MLDVEEIIVDVIKENFPNGIRDDFIDTGKVLRLLSTGGLTVRLSRNFIADVIRANGVEEGGRFYFIADRDVEKIERLFADIAADHSVVFYRAVFEQHAEFFSGMNIFSPEVLKNFLPDYLCDDDRMSARLADAIEEISSEEQSAPSLDQLKERFPYVPPDEISTALDNRKKRKRASKKSDAPKPPRGFSIPQLRKFIFEHDELTADKIFARADELSVERQTALNHAYELMIRAERNLFVADSLIRFDVDAIDRALTPFVQGKIIPLRAVTSFNGFPPVKGFTWNLFLLESFLRRFSRMYSFNAPAANSSNVGAVHPKSMHFKNYIDVQVAALIQEHVPLEKYAVENFLVEQGYRTNRVDRATDKIIRIAQEFSRR